MGPFCLLVLTQSTLPLKKKQNVSSKLCVHSYLTNPVCARRRDLASHVANMYSVKMAAGGGHTCWSQLGTLYDHSTCGSSENKATSHSPTHPMVFLCEP